MERMIELGSPGIFFVLFFCLYMCLSFVFAHLSAIFLYFFCFFTLIGDNELTTFQFDHFCII